MFEAGNFFHDYKKDTFYRFDLMPKANWERLQQETAAGVIQNLESQPEKNINAPSYLMIPCTPVPGEGAQTAWKLAQPFSDTQGGIVSNDMPVFNMWSMSNNYIDNFLHIIPI